MTHHPRCVVFDDVAVVHPLAGAIVGAEGVGPPGISFVRGLDARGLDAPLLTAQTTAVQIDVPVMF